MNKPRKAVLLLGSGVSLHAGLPSTNAIMEEIESKKDYVRHNDRLVPRTTEHVSDNHLRDEAQKIIQEISKRLNDFYSPMIYQTSYEDIANIIDALYDPMHHPHVQPFKEQLEIAVTGTASNYSLALNSKLDRAFRFIEEAVYRLTSAEPQPSKLPFILDGIKSRKLSLEGIITLNYDVVVEHLLTKWEVPFVDGFDDSQPLPAWSPEALQSKAGIPYLKMHGSVTWWRAMHDDDEWHLVKARWRPLASSFGYFTEPKQEILIGTENKIMAYSRSPYSFSFMSLDISSWQNFLAFESTSSVSVSRKKSSVKSFIWIPRCGNQRDAC